MLKISFLFMLLAGVFVRQGLAASQPEISLRVLPERDLVYSRGPREVVVQVEIEARRPERGRRRAWRWISSRMTISSRW